MSHALSVAVGVVLGQLIWAILRRLWHAKEFIWFCMTRPREAWQLINICAHL